MHDRSPSPIPRRRTLATKAANAISGGGHFIRLPHPPSANDEPRYGYGRPPHPRLSELLSRHDNEYLDVLRRFEAYTDELLAIPLDETMPSEPHWRNGFLFGLDGVSLYGFTRDRAPRRYIEVGSGNSTLFVDRARRDGDMSMEIVSIDPFPRREIDAICDSIVRQPLESADLEVFSGLQEGDIVFLDGTHRVFMNSDVTVFFLDVLPELPPGVLVGIHDIHLPDDYRPEHTDRYYSEQYLLAAYLLGESSWMRPALPCWYASHHPELGDLARSLVPPADPQEDPHGVIFWLLTEPRR
jgi:Methyltransferase domain